MLGIYTDEELRAELKRRAKARRLLQGRKPIEYIYLKAIVYHIDNIKEYTDKGERYKPFSQWKFRLVDCECEDDPRVVNWAFHCDFKCKNFKKVDAPKLGDQVLVKIRKVKQLMPSNVRESKIVEVIKRNYDNA